MSVRQAGRRELLVLRSPPELRFVLATRQDVRLRLHGSGWRES